MAMMNYSFSNSDEKLHSLLQFALTFVLEPDLSRGEVPGLNLQLRELEEVGSCGDEDGSVQIDAFPPGPASQAELFIVTFREARPDISRAGVYTPKEFYRGMQEEFSRQLSFHPERKVNAEKLIAKFKLSSRW